MPRSQSRHMVPLVRLFNAKHESLIRYNTAKLETEIDTMVLKLGFNCKANESAFSYTLPRSHPVTEARPTTQMPCIHARTRLARVG